MNKHGAELVFPYPPDPARCSVGGGADSFWSLACSRYPLPKIMVQAVTEAATVQNARTSAVCQRLSGL